MCAARGHKLMRPYARLLRPAHTPVCAHECGMHSDLLMWCRR